MFFKFFGLMITKIFLLESMCYLIEITSFKMVIVVFWSLIEKNGWRKNLEEQISNFIQRRGGIWSNFFSIANFIQHRGGIWSRVFTEFLPYTNTCMPANLNNAYLLYTAQYFSQIRQKFKTLIINCYSNSLSTLTFSFFGFSFSCDRDPSRNLTNIQSEKMKHTTLVFLFISALPKFSYKDVPFFKLWFTIN